MITLKKGDQAPEFEAQDQDGNQVRLKDFRGKKIILYFYPKDDTPGCTAESCNLRDNYTRLQKNGYIIFGVSKDNMNSHKKFIQKYKLPFALIADTDTSVQQAYGTWSEKSMFGKKYMGTLRATFVIDENGNIIDIIKKVKTKTHTDQILP